MDVAVHVIGRDDDPSGRDWQALLQEVVAYRNDQVVFRFCRHFDIGRHEASCILEQVMKWLWLCEYNRQCNPAPIRLHIDRPLKIIDEMWHNLILHTQDYAALCERFFGSFVDHFPATEADYSAHEDRRSSMSAEAFAHEQIQRRRPQYTMVYDLLGEQTFRTWYVEYPRTYTPELIRSLRR